MVNESYRLLKSGVGKRVLFLVDRRALAAQAVGAFATCEPEPNRKFDKIYEVYSQRFQKDDLEEGEKFDPKVLPRLIWKIHKRNTPSSTFARFSPPKIR
jgi:type I restriction enzyme R subunit